MRTAGGDRGLTLIEIVVAIVVVGITVPILTRNWFDVTKRSIQSETLYDGVLYGEQLMEEIRSKRFDEVTEPPWTPPADFGAKRSDESFETNRTLYDDVDDYDGFNETLTGGFRSSVRVEYVNVSGSSWQTLPGSGSVSDFKRITVSVGRSTMPANTTLITIAGRY